MRAQSLYGYFPSKHAIYDAMFGEASRELVARWRRPRSGSQDPVRCCAGGRRRSCSSAWRTRSGTSCCSSAPFPASSRVPSRTHPPWRAWRTCTPGCGRAAWTTPGPGTWTAMLAGLVAQQNANEPEATLAAARRRDHRHVPRALRARAEPKEGPIMIIEMLDVADIPALEHDEGMAVAAVEYDRLLELVDGSPDDWARDRLPRVGRPGRGVPPARVHEGQCRPRRGRPPARRRDREAEEQGILRLDAQTALRPRACRPRSRAAGLGGARVGRPGCGPDRDDGRAARQHPVDRAAGRRRLDRGYLIDVVFTGTGCTGWTSAALPASPCSSRRITTDRRRRRRRLGPPSREPFTLRLDGPAGRLHRRPGRTRVRLDAVEFCRILSGRGTGRPARHPRALRLPRREAHRPRCRRLLTAASGSGPLVRAGPSEPGAGGLRRRPGRRVVRPAGRPGVVATVDSPWVHVVDPVRYEGRSIRSGRWPHRRC